MCLTVKISRNTNVIHWVNNTKPTTRNIKVWKKLTVYRNQYGPYFKSPYQGFKYKPGEHYYQIPDIVNVPLWDNGKFHFIWNDWGKLIEIYIYDGLHVFKDKSKSKYYKDDNCIYIEMIIPKGSIVFRGIDGDIVTDNLIWYEDCKIMFRDKMYDNYESFIKNYKK